MSQRPWPRFAALLVESRTCARMTQEHLAGVSGVAVRAIRDLERGVALRPHADTVRRLADGLGLGGQQRAEFEAAAREHALIGSRAQASRDKPVAAGSGTALAAAPPAGAATAMRTLPRDVPTFIGRDAELQQLAEAGEAGNALSIYAIGGMAGVGKTAFAVHAAHQLAKRFPDGQLFVSLNAHTPGQRPVNPADALADLLQAAGLDPRQVPASLQARAAAWRDRVASKRVLLLLDDAAGHEQVRPLLPGTPGSLVLITSRRRLTALEDARAISLGALSPDQAVEMFARLADRTDVGARDPMVADVTKLCGYLPLAIGMLARRLHHRPAWTPADLCADAMNLLDLMRAEDLSVAAAFDLSYAELSASEQRMFRHLGLLPGTDIDAYAAAALDGIEPPQARRHLNAIYDQHLLSELRPGRYSFHDLIREHARALALADPPGERDAAIRRLLDYYLRAARMAGSRLDGRAVKGADGHCAGAGLPDLGTRTQATAWMEAERRNLLSGVHLAAEAGDLAAHAIGIGDAMAWFLAAHGYWDQSFSLQRTALRVARGTGDLRGQAEALSHLGTLYRKTGDFPAAAASQQEALNLSRACGDKVGEALALTQLGRVQYLTDDYPAALAGLIRALDLYEGLRDSLGQSQALTHLGYVQYIANDYKASAANLTRALALHEGHEDLEGQADAHEYLGDVQVAVGDYRAAADSFGQALRLCETCGDRNGVAFALIKLGEVQHLAGDHLAAAASLARALDLHLSLSNPLGEATARNLLGIAQRHAGDLRAATANQERALSLYRAQGSRLGEANALRELGALQQSGGDTTAAAASLAASLDLTCRIDDRHGQAESLNCLGDLSLALARPDQAQQRYEQALAIARELAAPLQEARSLDGIGRCNLRRGRSAEARSQLCGALEIYQRLGSPGATRIAQLLAAEEPGDATIQR